MLRFSKRKLKERIADMFYRMRIRGEKPPTHPLLDETQFIPMQENQEVLGHERGRLTPRKILAFLTEWRNSKPDPEVYEDIANEKSRLFAQRTAEGKGSDPRQDAANDSMQAEINARRRKNLREAMRVTTKKEVK